MIIDAGFCFIFPQVENEELKHILWSSVLFYKSPEVEMAACIMLSTKALYFILDDTASTLTDQARKRPLYCSILYKINSLFCNN